MTGRVQFFSAAVNRYRVVLGTPGCARFFGPAALGRVGVAMSPLAVLWAVHGSTSSFAQAGLATGAFAVADALLGPQVARAVDRYGQRRVISVTGGVFVVLVVVLAASSSVGVSGWLLAAVAGAAGAVVPPVGALSAARWRNQLSSGDELRVALSLEAVVNDGAFLLGPVLVTTLAAVVAPWAGVVLAGALVALGLVGILTATGSEPAPRQRGSGLLIDRRLVRRSFFVLAAANLAMGSFFGGIPLSITAFALDHHAAAWAGPIMALSSVVSLVAGVVYGALEHRREVMGLMVTAMILVFGVAGLSLISGIGGMVLGYALVGGCVAPILIPLSLALQRSVDRAVLAQAMTWMNSASAAGIAIAATVVGDLIQHHGPAAGFLGTAALAASLPLILAALTPPV